MHFIGFMVGTCILMHGYQYKIVDAEKEVFLLEQRVVVFEEQRTYREYWKKEWIEKHSKPVECK